MWRGWALDLTPFASAGMSVFVTTVVKCFILK